MSLGLLLKIASLPFVTTMDENNINTPTQVAPLMEVGDFRYRGELGNYNVNASFYDIREHFQGRDAKGRMKSTSDDERYNKLIADLRLEMKFLAKQIEPKIYEYGFLKE